MVLLDMQEHNRDIAYPYYAHVRVYLKIFYHSTVTTTAKPIVPGRFRMANKYAASGHCKKNTMFFVLI